MKNGKILRAIIAGVVAMTIFTACGTNKADNEKTNNTGNKTEQTDAADKENKEVDTTENTPADNENKDDAAKEEAPVEKTEEEIAAEEEALKAETIEYVEALRKKKYDDMMAGINGERSRMDEILFKGMDLDEINKQLSSKYSEEAAKLDEAEAKLIADIEKRYKEKSDAVERNTEIEINRIGDEHEVVLDNIAANFNAKKEQIQLEYDITESSIGKQNDIENNVDVEEEDDGGFGYHFYDDEKPDKKPTSGTTAPSNSEVAALRKEKEERLLDLQREKSEDEYDAKESKNNKESEAAKKKISELAKLEVEKIEEINKIKLEYMDKKKAANNLIEGKKLQAKNTINEYKNLINKETETRDSKIYELEKAIKDSYTTKIGQISTTQDKTSPSWEPILNKEVSELKDVFTQNDKKSNKSMDSNRFIYKTKIDNLLK